MGKKEGLKSTLVQHYEVARQEELNQSRHLRFISLWRVLSFLALAPWAYFFHPDPYILWPGLVLILSIFLFLLKRFAYIEKSRELLRSRVEVLSLELSHLEAQFGASPNGKRYRDDDHPFSADLDLFGEGSLFQRISRRISKKAQDKLAADLRSEQIPGNWLARKAAIEEWEKELMLRVDFLSFSALLKWEEEDELIPEDELGELPLGLMKGICITIPIASSIVLILYILDYVTAAQFIIYGLLSLGITGLFLKRVNRIYAQWGSLTKRMNVLSALFKLLSEYSWKSELNREISDHLGRGVEGISKLDKVISSFDQRNNMLLGIPLNALIQFDLQQILKLSRWKDNYFQDLQGWLEEVHKAELMASVGSYRWLRQKEICKAHYHSGDFELSMQEMAHPLMISSEAKANDIAFGKKDGVLIVTGANMAGKSTFLRALGLNIILARTFGFAHAKEMRFSNFYLFTGMRSRDSVQKGESYFFNELSRLKQLIAYRKAYHPLFVLLDEILKGTNSKDKAEGSRLFVEKLMEEDIRGVIATHDLSLCELEELFPDSIRNKRFEVEIKNDKLNFDYRLRDGVCETMNASWLLNHMELVPRKKK